MCLISVRINIHSQYEQNLVIQIVHSDTTFNLNFMDGQREVRVLSTVHETI